MTYAKEMYGKINDFLSWINPEITSSLKKESLDCVCEEIDNAERIMKQ